MGLTIASPSFVIAGNDAIVLPSGLVGYLQEVVTQNTGGGAIYRYRFVAPDFSNAGELETITADLEHLCAEEALPNLPNTAADGTQIVVSLSDAPSEFGVATPEVRQVFEAFRVENSRCIWEEF
jgi:hypothetical protein